MTARRIVAVFTGNRAEYGLQFPILRAIERHPDLDYRLIAGGAHLDEDFGATLDEIQADGLAVYAQVDVSRDSDTLAGTTQAIGSGILSTCRILEDLHPDWLVAYGDRYESFGAVVAATQMGIPTAHVEGGDYTDGGALDDSVRHAMTKLAHLHFTTNTASTERVIRLGEEPWRVHTVGLPSLDLIVSGDFARRDEVLDDLGLSTDRPIHLFCQHSVATEADRAVEQLRPSLHALGKLVGRGHQVVVTYPNDDAGGRRMIAEIDRLKTKPGFVVVRSLGRRRFLGMLDLLGNHARGSFIGNSSAGIKETPAFGCPVVNIGSRQHGRLRGDNVLDVPYDAEAIEAAARRCVDDRSFRAACRASENPYGSGEAGARIAAVLASTPLDGALLRKRLTY